MPDSFPGLYLEGGGRLRKAVVGSHTLRLYGATKNGTVLELEYLKGLDTLSVRSSWNNGHYGSDIQDCQVYANGFVQTGRGETAAPPGVEIPEIRVPAVKWTESFAVLQPPGP